MHVDLFSQTSIHVLHAFFNHFCYHIMSPCIMQSEEGRLTFLSRFAHSSPTLASWTEFHIFGGQSLLGPKICANMPLGQQSFPTGIVHCAIPADNYRIGLHSLQFLQLVSLPVASTALCSLGSLSPNLSFQITQLS